eukprot:10657746-Heterocapsa_arctica.AAC.1
MEIVPLAAAFVAAFGIELAFCVQLVRLKRSVAHHRCPPQHVNLAKVSHQTSKASPPVAFWP